MIENKKYYIDQINSSKAYKFTCLYHYSGVGFKKASLNLGIYRKEDNLLVGVLQWGCSAQEGIKLDRYVKEPIKKEAYLELNRFCMADSEGSNSESQAISLGIKWIKKNRPDIRLLVSYAGRKEGNYGYIYQATNWEYLGYFISPGFWSLDGHEKHLITLSYYYNKRGHGEGFTNFLINNYKDVRQTWTKQFIYIQRLDESLTPASPILPYPKPANEYPIKIKERIFIQDDDIYNHPAEIEREPVTYYYEKEDRLFTRAALIRQGVIRSTKDKRYVMYDNFGKKEKEYTKISAAAADGYLGDGIRKSINSGNPYKNKFFVECYYDEVVDVIETPYIAIVNEIPFYSYAEMGRYLGVSRQAIQQAKKKDSGIIAGKNVYWRE